MSIRGKVIFRVNAGKRYGLGHLTRNLALRDELIARDIPYLFLIKTDNIEYINFFLKSRDETHFITVNENISQDEELNLIFKHLNKKEDFLIIDHYEHNEEYFTKLKAKKVLWAEYDYQVKKHFDSQLVINPNAGVYSKDYFKLINKDTKLCIGEEFVIIRKEIREVAAHESERKHFLIAMGGGEYPEEVINSIVFLTSNLEKNYVVITSSNELLLKIGANMNVQCLQNPKDIAEIYNQSKFAMVAGGVTSNELAYLGVPMLMVPFTANQVNNTLIYQKYNYSLSFRNPDHFINILKSKGLESCLAELKHNFNQRKINLIDGNGTNRIVNKIINIRTGLLYEESN